MLSEPQGCVSLAALKRARVAVHVAACLAAFVWAAGNAAAQDIAHIDLREIAGVQIHSENPRPAAGSKDLREDTPALTDRRADTPAATPWRDDTPVSLSVIAAHFSAAQTQAAAGQIAEAYQTLESAVRLPGGDRFELWFEMARLAALLGDAARVRTCATNAVRADPGAVAGHYLLAEVEFRAGNPHHALARWRTCTLLGESRLSEPYVTAAWHQLGLVLEQTGHTRAAAQAYARFDDAVWRTHPEHRYTPAVAGQVRKQPQGTIQRQLALWEKLGERDEAVRAADAAVRQRPANHVAAGLYVDQLLAAGRAREALAFAWERLRSGVNGADPEGTFFMPALRAAQALGEVDGWIDEMLVFAQRTRQWSVLAGLADRLAEGGDWSGAARLWRVLQRGRPKDAELAWHAAWASWCAGERSEASRTLTEYLEQFPHNTEVVALALRERGTLPSKPAKCDTQAVEPAGQSRAGRLGYGLLALAAGAPDGPASPFALEGGQSETATASSMPSSAPVDTGADDELGVVQILHDAGRRLDQFEWQVALDKADEALRLAPRSAAALYVRGRALAALDQFEPAEDALREAVRLESKNALYAFELARLYQARGANDLVSAQRYFQEALAADPRMSAAAEGLVESYLAADPAKTELAELVLLRAQQRELPPDALRRMRTELQFADARWGDAHVAELASQFASHHADLVTGRRLVECKLARGEAAEAVTIATKLRQLAPQDESVLRLYSQTQGKSLNFPAAIEAQRLLQARYPARFDEQVELAVLLLNDFQLEEARQRLRAVPGGALEPERTERIRRLLFLAYSKFRELDAALGLLEEWDRPGSDTDWKGMRLEALLQAGRHDEALRQAEQQLDATPQNSAAREQFVVAAVEAGAHAKAAEKIQEWARNSDPMEQMLWQMQRVDVLRRGGLFREALDAIDSVQTRAKDVIVNPDMGQAQLEAERVACLIGAGRLDQGLELADKLLAAPEVRAEPQARFMIRGALIDGLRTAREFDRAVGYLGRWHAAGDPPPFDQLIAGWRQQFAQLSGRFAEYFELAEKQFERAPRDIGINNDLGYTWADQGIHLDRAERMVRYAVASDPLNAAYLDSLGWVYYKLGDFKQARHWLSRSVRLVDGQDATLYDHLGDICWRDGDREAARQAWQESVKLAEKLKPDSTAALDPKFLPRVQAKLEKFDGGTPDVAPVAGSTR